MKRFTVTYKSTYGFQVEQPVEAFDSKNAKYRVEHECADCKRILNVREG